MHIALVTDSHLSERAPECVQNWQAIADGLAAAPPDLTLHLGDITLDAEWHPEERAFAAQRLAGWPSPLWCLPGNHDMGNGSGEEPLRPELLARCVDHFGADRWWHEAEGWSLMGLDAQVLGSATEQEAELRDWVQSRSAALGSRGKLLLFLHRPVCRHPADVSQRPGRYLAPDAARWLLDGPLRPALRAVFSGHTHQALDFVAAGVRHVWVPSCAFVFPDAMQAPIGDKRVGLGWLELGANDTALHYRVRTFDGLRDHRLDQLGCYADLRVHHPAAGPPRSAQ